MVPLTGKPMFMPVLLHLRTGHIIPHLSASCMMTMYLNAWMTDLTLVDNESILIVQPVLIVVIISFTHANNSFHTEADLWCGIFISL